MRCLKRHTLSPLVGKLLFASRILFLIYYSTIPEKLRFYTRLYHVVDIATFFLYTYARYCNGQLFLYPTGS
jgi:hypothetical protein